MGTRDEIGEQNRTLIEDVTYGCCPKENYCTLKEIMMRTPKDARTMLLIKCIEKLKYERSHKETREIDWNEAFQIWVDEGYADRFAKLFCVGLRMSELYDVVVSHHRHRQNRDVLKGA